MTTIAYFDTSHDMPEEIISAAGFIPIKIIGNVHIPNDAADKYLPNFFCPAAKSWLTEALKSSQLWDGIVIAQGCNTTNRHFDIWYRHVKTPFLYWFNGPLKDDNLAHKFMTNEINKFIDALQQHFNISISNDALKEAINVSNKIKSRLREMAQLRSQKDITNREYLQVLLESLKKGKDKVLQLLNETLKEWQSRPTFPSSKKRIYLTGSDITYTEWMDTLEQCNVRVVRDDLTIGERYFNCTIPEMKDPAEALAWYYLNIPKPATKPGIGKRISFILSSIKETHVDGIISQNLKFCEPYAYDSVMVNNALKAEGYKLIHLERDFTPVADHQMINRISAFTETL